MAAKVLDGKVALITGAGRGIGKAVALAYAREGARLALCSRTARELEITAGEVAQLGAQAVAVTADVSQAKAVEGFVHRALTELGRIDILVNSVSPGYVATKMTNYGGAKPDSVVDLFVYLASDASVGVAGQTLDMETWRRDLGVRRKSER